MIQIGRLELGYLLRCRGQVERVETEGVVPTRRTKAGRGEVAAQSEKVRSVEDALGGIDLEVMGAEGLKARMSLRQAHVNAPHAPLQRFVAEVVDEGAATAHQLQGQ